MTYSGIDRSYIPSIGVDERMPVGVAGGLGAVRGTGFLQDAAHVIGDGVPADEELEPDIAVARARRDQPQDVDLAARQPVGRRAPGLRVGAERTRAGQQ